MKGSIITRLSSSNYLRHFVFSLLCLFLTQTIEIIGKVIDVKVKSKEIVLDGKEFGKSGAYELLKGDIIFAFDPANPLNKKIVDLQYAPRNGNGLVEATANFVILKPVDIAKGNKTALVEVSNRGGKFSLRYFNRVATRDLKVNNPEHFGDGLLMRMGLTVVWVGWQFDVKDEGEALRLIVPKIKDVDGSPIYGLVRCDWTIDETVNVLEISHRGHTPYDVADINDTKNILTARDGRNSKRDTIPRNLWHFAKEENQNIVEDSKHIYLESGFEEGKIYELVYTAKDPSIVGLGLGVIRDIISYAKYDQNSIIPVKYGVAVGVSQTGRFLRKYLYQGFNTDENGKKAYDGLMIITAGAGRGSFNHRFAQPSRDAHRYSAFFYPTDIFPFTGRSQLDSLTWRSDGLLFSNEYPLNLPKIFYINTGYEYWGRASSLIHTDVNGKNDVEPLPNERIYHIASGQHYVGRFPPADELKMGIENLYRGNPLEFKVNYRALLNGLVEWVSEDKLPPSSNYPRIDNETLVPINKLNFPQIEGFEIPKNTHTAYRVDYGPRWDEGIIDYQPPILGKEYPILVPQVDEFGNEYGGIRNVEITVPLATYAPWNLRFGYKGGSNEIINFLGTYMPLSKNEQSRIKSGDSRISIENLYASKKEYLEKVKDAADELVIEKFLLAEDVDYVVNRSKQYWEWILKE